MPCENSARKRSKTMAFRCTPEERKLICEMAAWSGMSRQDYIIAKLTDTQVEVRPSVSVQKALKDSMAELAKEVRLAASYGELSGSLQQRIELVMRFFLVCVDERNASAGGKVVDTHLCPGKPEHFVQLDAALVTDVGPCIISHNGSSLGVDLPCRHLLREIYSTQKRMQIRVRTYL